MTFRTAVLSSLLTLLAASPVLAQSANIVPVLAAVEDNAEQRINYSGKLRMLSQRIPAAACHLSRGIASDNARALLAGATTEFEQILLALEIGDEALNIIQPEQRRKTLARIHELRETWEPFKATAQAIVEDNASETQLNYLLSENLPVLNAAQLLVEELVKQYSNPNAVTRASLMLIDISGRQRMLTQRISKETCMIGGVHETAQTGANLESTARVFEASLQALRFGMTEVGINPPPNAEISEGLQVALNDWAGVKPLVAEVLASGEIDDADHAIKFVRLNTTMANMNTVVGMYADAAK